MKVNLFIDGGATITTATKKVKEALNPPSISTTMKVSGFLQKKKPMKGWKFPLFIKGIGKGFNKELKIETVHCLEELKMPELSESFSTGYDISDNPLLRDLPFVEPDNTQIDILVGRDVPELHQVLEDIYRPDIDTVHACKSVIGWYLAGPSCRKALQEKTEDDSVNFALTEVDETPDVLEAHLRRLEKYDFNDPIYSKLLGRSRDDLKAQQIVDSSIHKVGGMYSIALTWKDSFVGMPDNRCQAERRLKGLIPQFKKVPEFHKKFAEKMEENISQHAEEVTPNMEKMAMKGTINYISQFGVTSASKFRVVNDAKAKSLDGLSINDRLLQGEDILTALNAVLLRSRQHKYLFVCDIKAMFLSVAVAEQDRDALRFLWFDKGDYNQCIKTYRWKKWCFGLNSAPYAATKALRQTALDNEPGVSSDVVNVIFNNTYVDDILKSCKTIAEANKLANGIVSLCSSGNFEVAKFQANSKEILKGIAPERVLPAKGEVSLDLHSEETKLLGMFVDFKTNEYFFKITPDKGVNTRRGVLRYYMKIFDPLGLLNIYILPVKQILQQAIVLKLDWDEPFPDVLQRKWTKWKEHLNALQDLRVDVCLKPSDSYSSIQLHVFVDASKIGYGACAYVRTEYSDHVRVTLVTSKGRICPRKALSIIKLEVQAGVVGSRLAQNLRRTLDEISFTSTHLWSDSKSFLHMLKNNSKRFEIWFAVRLGEIHESTEIPEWRYCPTKINCADHLSRGVMPGDVKRSESFYSGPEFLKLPEDGWPKAGLEDEEKVAATVAHLYAAPSDVEPERSGIQCMIEYYDDIFNLKRAVSFVIRFIKAKLQPKNDVIKGRVTSAELTQAERLIISTVQKEAFPELMKQMKDYDTAEEAMGHEYAPHMGKSELKKLRPILVRGILRTGGRLSNSFLSEDAKHPIILPKESNFTSLVIDYHHKKNAHMGAHITLSSIRQKFWIISGLRTTKKRIGKCMKCRMLEKKPCEQIISNLPEFRVTPEKPVFNFTLVDLCGPYLIKQGRSRVKRWVTLFTCAATRASDIQVVHSLETDSFLKAMSRFMDIRQCQPGTMVSDCGTNFVGADRELKKFLTDNNQNKKISDELSRKGVSWQFNPPKSSHRAGLVERLFRIFRKCMKSLTDGCVLDDEDFLTATAQINSILNNRPITALSDEPNDLRTLTPAQLLSGAAMGNVEPLEFLNPLGYRRNFKRLQEAVGGWWSRWRKQYLHTLQERQKWWKPARNLTNGDLVLMVDDDMSRGQWRKALVVDTFPDKYGTTRKCQIKTANGTIFMRDIRKLVLLEGTTN